MALTRSQYNQIMRIYLERRRKNDLKHEERLKEVCLKVPEIKEINDSMRSLAMRNARDIISGKAPNADEYKKELEALKAQKKKLMRTAGFSEDYLDMQYDCMYCKDTGYIGTEKCRCFKKMQLEFLYAQSGLERILKKENFAAFREDIFDDTPVKGLQTTNRRYMKDVVYKACFNFSERFGDNEKSGVLFTGPAGAGKTFLSNCIAEKVLGMGYSVVSMTATELFDLMAEARFGDGDEGVSDSRDMLFECDLLIIDDLGTEMQSDFVNSQLFSLVNSRMIHRRSTVISTNLTMQGIRDLYSERIASRIMSDYMVIPLYGKDLRLQGGKNGR